MSSPRAASTEAPRQNETDGPTQADIDVDADMEDVTQDTTTNTGAKSTANDPNSTTQPDPTQITASTQHPTTTQQSMPDIQIQPLQSRKDVTLRDFLSKMDDYAPIIPDAVTAHYLTLAGLPPPSAADPSGATTGTTPLPLARLLALATQKFVADLAADAYQYSRIRASNTTAGAGGLGAGLPVGVPGAPGAVVGAMGGVGVGVGGQGKGGGLNSTLGVQRAGYGGGGQGGTGQGKTVLTMEDLGMAVGEYGVNVKRGEFYR